MDDKERERMYEEVRRVAAQMNWRQTCGNCRWFDAWGTDGDGSCNYRPFAPMGMGIDYWVDGSTIHVDRVATECHCWKSIDTE